MELFFQISICIFVYPQIRAFSFFTRSELKLGIKL